MQNKNMNAHDILGGHWHRHFLKIKTLIKCELFHEPPHQETGKCTNVFVTDWTTYFWNI